RAVRQAKGLPADIEATPEQRERIQESIDFATMAGMGPFPALGVLRQGARAAAKAGQAAEAAETVQKAAGDVAEFVGNINVKRFGEGVADVIKETFERDPVGMEAARRGVVTDERLAELAAAA